MQIRNTTLHFLTDVIAECTVYYYLSSEWQWNRCGVERMKQKITESLKKRKFKMVDLLSGSAIIQLNYLVYFKKELLKTIILCVPYILLEVLYWSVFWCREQMQLQTVWIKEFITPHQMAYKIKYVGWDSKIYYQIYVAEPDCQRSCFSFHDKEAACQIRSHPLLCKYRTASVLAAKLATVNISGTASLCSNPETYLMHKIRNLPPWLQDPIQHHVTFSTTKKPFLLNQQAWDTVYPEPCHSCYNPPLNKLHEQW